MIDHLDIHAYADRELAPEDMARLQKQISESPEAARELSAIQGLKGCLQSKAQQVDCEPLWHRCVGRLDELDKVKKAEFFVGKYAWALCGLLVFVIFFGGMYTRSHAGTLGMSQVASDLSGLTSAPMPGTQPEQLQSWILDQTGHRPMLTIDGRQVQAVAYANTAEGRHIVRFSMANQDGPFNLLIIPNVESVDGVDKIGDGLYGGQINGKNCVIKPDSGCAVLVVGDRTIDQLKALALSMYR